jgi:hypothetical protein
MASLIVQYTGQTTAGVFTTRALIGRKPFNGVEIENRVVSRIHAWIERDGDSFYLADARSRGGTTVNGNKIEAKTTLHDGDEIGIGPAKVTFHSGEVIPEGAIRFEITENGSNPSFKDPGLLIRCDCGGPLWVPKSMAGAFGQCNHCHRPITVPGVSLTGIARPLTPHDSIVDMPAIRDDDPLAAGAELDAHFEMSTIPAGNKAAADPMAVDPWPKPADSQAVCSICQSPILPSDATQHCPSCSQVYHAECWNDNRGCAAYGCPQVNALEPKQRRAASPLEALAEAARERTAMAEAPKTPFPWEFALLGSSVVGSIIGAFTFGVPALAVGTASTIYAIRRRDAKARIAALSAGICLIGVVVGIATSCLIYSVRISL